jgi:hypothetical protein
VNINDIVFSQVDENGPITHAIIGGRIFFSDDKARAMVRDAILIEREACAKLVEDAWIPYDGWIYTHDELVAMIRARP